MLWAAFLAGLLATVHASPFTPAELVPRAAPACKGSAKSAYTCLSFAGSSSYLTAATTTTTPKTVATVTSTTSTITRNAPTSTISAATSAPTTVQESITVATVYTTVITVTSTTSTITSTSSLTSTVYTCPSPFPTPAKQRRADTTSYPPEATTKAQSCVNDYGWINVSSACNGCVTPPLSTPTSTVTAPTSTSTTTTKIKTTTTVTPVVTVYTTTAAAPTVTNTNSQTLSTATTTTLFTDYTTTTTVTSTVTSASPTSTAFSITYKSTDGSVLTARKVQSPGSAGTLIAFGTGPGDLFSGDPSFHLFDGSIVEKNAQDPYPYLFLDFDNTPVGSQNPRFTTCDGKLTGYDAPGAPSSFALCDGFLVLGGSFGADGTGVSPCTPITLGYQFPDPSAT